MGDVEVGDLEEEVICVVWDGLFCGVGSCVGMIGGWWGCSGNCYVLILVVVFGVLLWGKFLSVF